MTTLSISILQKVREELQVSEDITSIELYDLLHKYRSSQHPDKYLDEKLKKDAEEKFKKLNALLLELANFIEQEKQQKKPSDIISYQKDYEIVKIKQDTINYQKEIEDLKSINEYNESTIKNLKKEILRLQGDKIDEKTLELVRLYKPSKKSLLSLGVTFLLTFIIGVLTKIEEVAQIIAKYFPFDPHILNLIIFGVLIIIPLYFGKKYYEESQIEYAARRIKTPHFIKQFVIYLKDNYGQDNFFEIHVYTFLSNELKPKNIFLKFWYSNILNIYSETTIASLKDIFIYNLLNRQLISISSAELLDRKFDILKTRTYNYDTFNFDDLEF